VFPDLQPGRLVQVALKQFDTHAAVEGGVEALHAVAGQEEHALLIFKQPQEDPHDGVARYLVFVPLLQLDVGLVQKQDSVPGLAYFEDLL